LICFINSVILYLLFQGVCQTQDSHLVIIETATENDFLKLELSKLHPGATNIKHLVRPVHE